MVAVETPPFFNSNITLPTVHSIKPPHYSIQRFNFTIIYNKLSIMLFRYKQQLQTKSYRILADLMQRTDRIRVERYVQERIKRKPSLSIRMWS